MDATGRILIPHYADRKYSELGYQVNSPDTRLDIENARVFVHSRRRRELLAQYGVAKVLVTSDFEDEMHAEEWSLIENTRSASLNGLLHTDGVDFALFNNGTRPSSTAFLGRTKGLEVYSQLLPELSKRTGMNFSYVRESIRELLENNEEYEYAEFREDDEVYHLLVYGVLFAMSDHRTDSRREAWFDVMHSFTQQMKALGLLLEEDWSDGPTLLLISRNVLHYRLPIDPMELYEENHSYRMSLDSVV